MKRGYASMNITSMNITSMNMTSMNTANTAIANAPTENTAPNRHSASTTAASELTIVIPAKNEAKLIPRLLTSLTNQDYSKMPNTRVLVADANSTDGTPEIVLSFRDRLNVSVIRGGTPSVGRNLGAAHADSTYILFLDAYIELAHLSVVRRSVELAQRKQLHCVTTNILCQSGSWLDKMFYAGNDFFQYLSRLHHPFATGMFM